MSTSAVATMGELHNANNDAVYSGSVMHRRRLPQRQFQYPVGYVFFDIRTIDQTTAQGMFSRRRSPIQWRREDYCQPTDLPLYEAVVSHIREQTGEIFDGDISVLTVPRLFGRVFNPVSLYYCWHPDRHSLAYLVADVSNTPYGERHIYVVDGETNTGAVDSRVAKAMRVSPLLDMDYEYHVRSTVPGETLDVSIDLYRNGATRPYFETQLSLNQESYTDEHLIRSFVKMPLGAVTTLRRIYWQALLTWVRGGRT